MTELAKPPILTNCQVKNGCSCRYLLLLSFWRYFLRQFLSLKNRGLRENFKFKIQSIVALMEPMMKLVINSEPSVVSNLINDLLMRRGQILERTDISAGNIN